MKLINLASTSMTELVYGSGKDLAEQLWTAEGVAALRIPRPGGDPEGEAVELERGVLVEQQELGAMGGEGWGLHLVGASFEKFLENHLTKIGRGFRDPQRYVGPASVAPNRYQFDPMYERRADWEPDAGFAGVIVLDLVESWRPLWALASPTHQDAFRGWCWRYANQQTEVGFITDAGDQRIERLYDLMAMRLCVATLRRYREVYPKARFGVTNLPGAVMGFVEGGERGGMFYTGRGVEKAAMINNRLWQIVELVDFGIAVNGCLARSDETAPRGVQWSGVWRWWDKQELPADVTEAMMSTITLETRRVMSLGSAGPKPVFAMFNPRYAGSDKKPWTEKPLSDPDARRVFEIPVACGAAGWIIFDHVAAADQLAARLKDASRMQVALGSIGAVEAGG